MRPETGAAKALAGAIRSLASAAVLPAPEDIDVLIPPSLPAHVRCVHGTSLWLWYTATDDELILRALTDTRPA